MKLQINKRKAFTVGAMGLLLGAAVIPATVSAAELVSPAASTTKVTNPGNIVNDDNTYYDKYEWYKGGDYAQLAGYESGHYTKKLDAKAHYTFEVKNDTSKKVSFLPAIDLLASSDPVYANDTPGKPDWRFFGNFLPDPNAWEVAPGTTKVVTVSNLDSGMVSIKKGLYIYLYGLGKNDSTAGITYSIYKGDSKNIHDPNVKELMNYKFTDTMGNITNPDKKTLDVTTTGGNSTISDVYLAIDLNNHVDTKYFPGGYNLKANELVSALNSPEKNFSTTGIDFMDTNKCYTAFGAAVPWIERQTFPVESPYTPNSNYYLRIRLKDVSVTKNEKYLIINFSGTPETFNTVSSLKIPLVWKQI